MPTKPTFELHDIIVPSMDPVSCIFIDGILEQIVEKPDMARVVDIEVAMCLKLYKEVLSLLQICRELA